MIASWLICCPSPDFLSFNACYSSLPQRVRLSSDVSQTLAIAQCVLSDSMVRLSELLPVAPYSVAVLVVSRFTHLRSKSVKYLASAKLKLPFDCVVRHAHFFAPSSSTSAHALQVSRSKSRCPPTAHAFKFHLARPVQAARCSSHVMRWSGSQPTTLWV